MSATEEVLMKEPIEEARQIERWPDVPAYVRGVLSEFPILGGLMESMIHLAERDFRNRLIEFLEGLAADIEATPEAVLRRIREDERLRTLFIDAVGQASRSHLDDKRRALRRALARGLLARDDAMVDETEMALHVLRDIEAPHLRVLWFLWQLPPSKDQRGRESPPGPVAQSVIAEEMPGTEHVLDPIMTTLERHSLVLDVADAPYGMLQGGWALTSFGRTLLRLITDEDSPN